MNDRKIVDSSFTAIINAPIDRIDIPRWCFALSERDYQECSPAHISAGFTTARVGSLQGATVAITGKVTLYKGRPQIILRSADQLRVAMRAAWGVSWGGAWGGSPSPG